MIPKQMIIYEFAEEMGETDKTWKFGPNLFSSEPVSVLELYYTINDKSFTVRKLSQFSQIFSKP